MAKQIFSANALTGGVSGCLDDILHTSLETGNLAIVIDASTNTATFYKYDASDASAENSPSVIIPDSNVTGTGAWLLSSLTADDITAIGDATIGGDVIATGDLGGATATITGAATAASLELGGAGATVDEFSTDGTMAGNSDTAVPTEKAVTTYVIANGIPDSRSIFTYNGGATAYTVKCAAAVYRIKDKIATWTSEVTTDAIGTPSADTWYYLYLDYSAITTGVAITNSELIWSSTAPTFNTTYRQLMNGDDRCIFAILTNAAPDNIIEFWHDGGEFVQYGDDITVLSAAAISTSFVAQDISSGVPAFSSLVKVGATFYSFGGSTVTNSSIYYRPYGSAATSGIIVNNYQFATSWLSRTLVNLPIMVGNDSGVMKIDLKESVSTNAPVSLFLTGYYFPIGM